MSQDIGTRLFMARANAERDAMERQKAADSLSLQSACSAWIPVESEPVPDGLVCDMVREGWDRITNVVYLDDWVYFEDALHHDPNGDAPDPIELCPITEITHWAKIVLPNGKDDRT